MSESTSNTPGAGRIGPGGSPKRTGADRAADTVSALILAFLVTFAVAVSFAHVMQFIRDHGQHVPWVVVGTASTVVGLTALGGIEVWRDSRARRKRGAPALLLAVGIAVELGANMATAPGSYIDRGVAGWPVGVAAAGVYLVTRRLQHAAEAAERVQLQHDEPEPAERGVRTVADRLVERRDVWAEQLQAAREHPLQDAEPELLQVWGLQDAEPEPEPPAAAPVPAEPEPAAAPAAATKRERVLQLLETRPDMTPQQIADAAGCSRQYVYMLQREDTPGDGQIPGQISALDQIAEAGDKAPAAA